MNDKTTIKITREQAINIIMEKMLKPIEDDIKNTLKTTSNNELEQILDEIYYENEFENYEIKDGGE